MSLSIRHPRAEKLARQVAEQTGKPITTVVLEALEVYAACRAQTDERDRLEQTLAYIAEADRMSFKDAIDDFNAEIDKICDYRLAS